jgi:glycosyltransferase involved in cell wall biosynthesis
LVRIIGLKQLKVLHILQNYEPSKGGTQFLFKNVSEILVQEYKDEVTVFTTNSEYDPSSNDFLKIDNRKESINGVNVVRFSFNRSLRPFLKLVKRSLRFLFNFYSNFLDLLIVGPNSISLFYNLLFYKGDVICGSSSAYSFMSYPTIKILGIKKIPFVFMGAIHFDNEETIQLNPYIVKRINQSQKYIANTNFEKKCLISLGVNEKKINVIGCGVSLEKFGKTSKMKAREFLNLPNDSFVIGYVGRFAYNKGIGTLIEAFDLFNKPNSLLVLAGGKNDYLFQLKEIVRFKYPHLEDKICFIVNFDEETKERIYSSFDIFVTASTSESFGIVFLEAWASRKPVIGADIGAIRSVISDKKDGLLFEKKSSFDLSTKFSTYYNNPKLRIDHANAGIEKVNQYYTWNIIAEKYRNTYLEAILTTSKSNFTDKYKKTNLSFITYENSEQN